MLKKSLIVQIVVILIQITLGSILLGQLDPTVKAIHGFVGILVGLTALSSVFFAFREKASGSVLTLTLLAAFFSILAYIGGKIAATDYDFGLILMRSSAILALLLGIFCLYKVWKNRRPA